MKWLSINLTLAQKCFFIYNSCICMEKAMAPHSSTLAWKIPWTEEPGRLQSTGSLRVGHDWATSLSLFTSCSAEGNGSPLQCSCLENPRDGGAWWAAIYGVAQSWARLKRLSSSSSSIGLINSWTRGLNQRLLNLRSYFVPSGSFLSFHCIISASSIFVFR